MHERFSWAHPVGIWTLAVAAFLCLPMAFHVSKGLAPLAVVAALAATMALISARPHIAPLGRTAWLLTAFIVFTMVSCAWSPEPASSLQTAVAFAATVAAGWAIFRFAATFRDTDRRLLETAIIGGGLVGYGLLAIDYATHGGVVTLLAELTGRQIVSHLIYLGLKPGLAVGAFYIWPWGYAIMRRWGKRAGIPAVVVAAFLLIESDSAVTAVSIGALVALTAALFARRIVLWLGLALAISVALLPVVARQLPDPTQPESGLEFLPNSAVHRLAIWRLTAEHVADAPLLGRGFDSTRTLYGPDSTRMRVFLPDVPDRRWTILSEPIPLHPHNLILQVWLELGGVGAFLLITILISALAAIRHWASNAMERATAFGVFASAFTISNIGFGAWQSWWLSALLLVGGITIAILHGTAEPALNGGTPMPEGARGPSCRNGNTQKD